MKLQNITLSTLALATLLLFSPVTIYAAGSSGGGSAPIATPKRALTPEQVSEKQLRAGIKNRDKALKYEARAEQATSEKSRNKYLAKARKQYDKAIEKQGDALRTDPRNYKAANELGYALRKTGDYRKAIGAYNYALELNPSYHQATEYRAEAFLALGMLDLTKQAYMTLFRNNRGLAEQLMASFDKWAAGKGEEFSEAEQEFLNWVAERKRVAEMAARLSMHTPAEGAQHHWPSS